MSEPRERESEPRPADATAAAGLDTTPVKTGPALLSVEHLTAGEGTSEDPVPEQLDWGSIEDEDGAFGQLSAAFKIHGQDPEDSATQKTSGRQTPSAKRIDGAT